MFVLVNMCDGWVIQERFLQILLEENWNPKLYWFDSEHTAFSLTHNPLILLIFAASDGK